MVFICNFQARPETVFLYSFRVVIYRSTASGSLPTLRTASSIVDLGTPYFLIRKVSWSWPFSCAFFLSCSSEGLIDIIKYIEVDWMIILPERVAPAAERLFRHRPYNVLKKNANYVRSWFAEIDGSICILVVVSKQSLILAASFYYWLYEKATFYPLV